MNSCVIVLTVLKWNVGISLSDHQVLKQNEDNLIMGKKSGRKPSLGKNRVKLQPYVSDLTVAYLKEQCGDGVSIGNVIDNIVDRILKTNEELTLVTIDELKNIYKDGYETCGKRDYDPLYSESLCIVMEKLNICPYTRYTNK